LTAKDNISNLIWNNLFSLMIIIPLCYNVDLDSIFEQDELWFSISLTILHTNSPQFSSFHRYLLNRDLPHSIQFNSIRSDLIRFYFILFYLIWFDSIRFDSIWFDSIRFD
jgi:hypothetical protein